MIPAYTYNSINAILLSILLDRCLETHIMQKKKFWFLMTIVMIMTYIFDNTLIRIGVYSFNSKAILNIFIPFAPIENYFMSFSLISGNVILYEWRLKNRILNNK